MYFYRGSIGKNGKEKIISFDPRNLRSNMQGFSNNDFTNFFSIKSKLFEIANNIFNGFSFLICVHFIKFLD